MTNPATDHKTPARQLADLIGEDNAGAAIEAGWDALRELNGAHTIPLVHPGVADYVATVVILAAFPTILRRERAEAYGQGRDDEAGALPLRYPSTP